MAMYTSLVCTAKIKPEFHEKVSKAIYGSEVVSWDKYFKHDFVSCESAYHIPFMNTCLTEEEELNVYKDGILNIDCEVRNHDSELDLFFEFLQEISEEITEFTTWYEENKEYDYKTDTWEYSWYNYLTKSWEKYYIPECKIQEAFEEHEKSLEGKQC